MTDTRDPHTRALDIDAEIRRLYLRGEGTMAISKRLGLRPALVISRVRGLDLAPPGMPKPKPAEPAQDALAEEALATQPPVMLPPPDAPIRPVAGPKAEGTRRRGSRADRAHPRPRSLAASLRARARSAAAEDDDDTDDFPVLPGRPRGWLITEREHYKLFARHGERFEDFLFLTRSR